MDENAIAKAIVDAGLGVHRALGPGLLESVYEAVLAHELRSRGFDVERQVSVPVRYQNMSFDEGFRADLMVNRMLIVELKCVEKLMPVHRNSY